MIKPKTPKTQEQEMLETVWMRAFRDGVCKIEFKSTSDRTGIRFKLYSLAKKVKCKPEDFEPDLVAAVNNCSIKLEAPSSLRVIRVDKSTVLQDLASQLGVQLEQPTADAPDQAEMDAMLTRLNNVQAEVDKNGPENFAVKKDHRFNYPRPDGTDLKG